MITYRVKDKKAGARMIDDIAEAMNRHTNTYHIGPQCDTMVEVESQVRYTRSLLSVGLNDGSQFRMGD